MKQLIKLGVFPNLKARRKTIHKIMQINSKRIMKNLIKYPHPKDINRKIMTENKKIGTIMLKRKELEEWKKNEEK